MNVTGKGIIGMAQLYTNDGKFQILILQMFKNLTKPEKEFMKLVLHFLFFFHLVWFRLFFFALKYNRNISQPVDCLIIRGISRLYQSVTNIFKYSNIRIYWSQIYIWTFVRINFSFTNIFGHSFVSNLFVQIYSDIRW